MQYTIRTVPPKVDQALRARARKTGKSLNAVALEALAKGADVSDRPVVYHDLDWMFGSENPTPPTTRLWHGSTVCLRNHNAAQTRP